MINFHSFSDELEKIAEQNRKLNREKLKQFFGNTALVGAGAGLGVGAAELARAGLKRFAGSPASKIRQAAAIGLPLLGAGAVYGYKRELDKEKERTLAEAYQRGVRMGQKDV